MDARLSCELSRLNRAAGCGPDVPGAWRREGSHQPLGGQTVDGPDGSFCLIRQPVSALGSRLLAELVQQHCQAEHRLGLMPAELRQLARSFPHRALYLDLETCGFTGTPLFLIGLLRQIDGQLVIEQLLARDYSEEPAILGQLWSLLPGHDVLVTFNGKAFDWPFVLERTAVHRIEPPSRGPDTTGRQATEPGSRLPLHCDLLLFARRHWKRRLALPNCKLQTLETLLCRRYRSGDIPGYEIPAAYHAFVQTGDPRQLRLILHHNALDLLTLAELSLTMLLELGSD